MKSKLIAVIILILAGAGFWLFRSNQEKPAAVDPAFHHSAAGAHKNIQDFYGYLEDAYKRNDLRFIHDHMYYLKGLAEAFSEKLDATSRQKLSGVIGDFIRNTEELDHFSARGNMQATLASLQKMSNTLHQMDVAFRDLQ